MEDVSFWDKDDCKGAEDAENDDNFSDDDSTDQVGRSDIIIKFRSAAFTWGMKDDVLLEIEDLEIPAGKTSQFILDNEFTTQATLFDNEKYFRKAHNGGRWNRIGEIVISFRNFGRNVFGPRGR